MPMVGFSLALSAGICAALASTCAKLAMHSGAVAELCYIVKRKHDTLQLVIPDCDSIALSMRIISFCMVFIFNAVMWTLFVKSLRKCTSSLEATVINTASNFFFSAFLGMVLFGETLSLVWWFGASLIVIGLLFIHKGTAEDEDLNKKSL
ncbi:uncharacterized protein LOC100369684 [Saccoglossus kowalevskii]|uniref:Transmembrane protein 42-like n=1 Tax=Saccoglossus kowalevskii TaxID=10224 RepID=A0ABM0GWZ6_SACKO|nr:PREDICTED: transmembrane protein 42-like [Saccoglossus kowalevskii]